MLAVRSHKNCMNYESRLRLSISIKNYKVEPDFIQINEGLNSRRASNLFLYLPSLGYRYGVVK